MIKPLRIPQETEPLRDELDKLRDQFGRLREAFDLLQRSRGGGSLHVWGKIALETGSARP